MSLLTSQTNSNPDTFYFLTLQDISGLTGIAGPTGAQGAQGVAGAQGATGAQGSAGMNGETGPQGAQGQPGSQGVQGPTGAQGAQGSGADASQWSTYPAIQTVNMAQNQLNNVDSIVGNSASSINGMTISNLLNLNSGIVGMFIGGEVQDLVNSRVSVWKVETGDSNVNNGAVVCNGQLLAYGTAGGHTLGTFPAPGPIYLNRIDVFPAGGIDMFSPLFLTMNTVGATNLSAGGPVAIGAGTTITLEANTYDPVTRLGGVFIKGPATAQTDLIFRNGGNIRSANDVDAFSISPNVINARGTATDVGVGTDLNLNSHNLKNVNQINGAPYPPPSSWVPNATSDLSMNNYNINEVNKLQTTYIQDISGFTGTAGQILTATSQGIIWGANTIKTKLYTNATYTLNSSTLSTVYPTNPQISVSVPFSGFGTIPSAINWLIKTSWFQQIAVVGTPSTTVSLGYYMKYRLTNPDASGGFAQTNSTNEFFPSSSSIVSGADTLQAFFEANGYVAGYTPTNSSVLTINFFIRLLAPSASPPSLSPTGSSNVAMTISATL